MKALVSRFYLLALMLANFYIFQSCENIDQEIVGSGIEVEEERTYTDYSEIEVKGDFNITIVSDSNYSLVIVGDNNIIPFINTQIDGNKLKIYTDEDVQISNADIEIKISLPELTSFVSQGNVSVSSQDTIIGNVLAIDSDGKSNLDLKLEINYLTVNLRGASTSVFEGIASECLLDLAGNILLTSNLMEVSDLDLTKEGNVTASVFTSDKLVVNSKGTGDIFCYGNPGYIEQDMKGNGKLILQ